MAIEYMAPTEEIIMDCLVNNTLERQNYVIQFCHLLASYNEATTIALDGFWGSGKTFFVKQCKQVLDATNCFSEMEQEKRNNIIKAIKCNSVVEHLKNTPSYTVYYDAWEHDDQSDPLLSLIYSIATETNTVSQLETPRSPLKMVGLMADVVCDRSVFQVLQELKGNNPLSVIRAQTELKVLIQEYLCNLPHEHGNRVNIIIDELDRCSPRFAINLLERIKHYCIYDNITFVFSVNLQSLEKTVCHYYGEQMEGTRYLDRFFDLRMMLPQMNDDYLLRQLDFGYVTTGTDICKYLIKRFNFSLREALRYAAFYRKACKIQHNDSAVIYWIKYFLPIAIALELKDMDLFQSFISGNNDSQLELLFEIDVIQDQLKRDFCRLIGINDTSKIDTSSIKEFLKELYKAFFKFDFTKESYVHIRNTLEVSAHTRLIIYDSVGLFCNLL